MFESLQTMHTEIDPSIGFYYDTICDNLPNSILLKQNALFRAIIDNRLFLSHQTSRIEQIKSSGRVNPGWGCLGEVLYTTPIYVYGGAVFHDNFFNLVLSHQKNKTKELIVKLNTKKLKLYGMNYLLAGQSLYEIADNSYLKTKPEFQKALQLSKKISKEISIIKNIDKISILAKKHPFFSYVYYESLSQVVMLSAEDEKTKQLLNRGEFNADCYYNIVKEFSGISSNRFDASFFCPNQKELEKLLIGLEEHYGIETNSKKIINYTIDNFNAIIKKLAKKGDIKKHLVGQFLKDILKEKDLAFLLSEFNSYLNEYRKENHINLIINCASLKPEIGIPINTDVCFFEKTAGGNLEKLELTYEKVAL